MDISEDNSNSNEAGNFLSHANVSFSSIASTSSTSRSSFSMFGPLLSAGLNSPIVNKWTPPGSPSRTKLRSEYQSRIKSPSKRRMSLEMQSHDSIKRTNSPVHNRRHSYGEVYSDRFIPSRGGSQMEIAYSLMDSAAVDQNNNSSNNNINRSSSLLSSSTLSTTASMMSSTSSSMSSLSSNASTGAGETIKESQSILNMLLKSELLGVEYTSGRQTEGANNKAEGGAAIGGVEPAAAAGGYKNNFQNSATPNLFKFKSARQHHTDDLNKSFSILPVGNASRRLLSTPRKAKRKIPKVPFKVLDAPALQDDFYLNLVDWSSLNVLAVGLGSCVYLWSACTSKVTKLCDLGPEDCVTSVAWTQRGTHLAVGTNLGEVQIWEASRCKKIRTMAGHSARIGTLSWNAQVLASGSRDRLIYLRDVRVREPYISKLQGHKQEVCGLKWSFDDNQLASGGNDNKLFIWNLQSSLPVQRFNEHSAAVKAIAWSPHQHGLLASGGGTADRCIRFWNTLSGTALNCIDTGSQVCNLMWSKNINEIVSTHGYSLNQIIVWRYPSMTKVATLTGHTYRVLYLAMSPDGQTIVTGAGDETLRFWNAFPGPKSNDGCRLGTSLLFPAGADIR